MSMYPAITSNDAAKRSDAFAGELGRDGCT
jgi:hypothetical protein